MSEKLWFHAGNHVRPPLWLVSAFIVCFFALPSLAHGATLYWVGNDGANTSTATNWKTTDPAGCGSGNASAAPSTGDIATFDPDCDNGAAINSNLSVAGWDMQSGYTGTVTQNSSITLTVGTSNYNQAGGTFTGSAAAITINGTYTLSGGTFTSTSGTLTTSGNWTVSGGTFSHNSGTVVFGGNGVSYTITGSHTLSNVKFSTLNGGNTVTIASGTTLTVTGTLTFTNSGQGGTITINTGAIEAQGDINQGGGFSSGKFGNGTATLTINGSANQTLTGDAASFNRANLPPLTINKTGGTLTLSGTITVDRDWTYTAGTLNAGTSTVIFSGNGVSYTITGSQSFNNLSFSTENGINTVTITSGTTLTATGTLTFSYAAGGGGSITINTGIIAAQGNITVADTGNYGGGTAVLNLTGSANQTITANGASGLAKLPSSTVTINKSSGTVTLGSAFNFSVSGQDLTITSGTLNLAGYNLTVNDVLTVSAAGTLQMQGAETITATTKTLSSGSTVTFTGDGDGLADTYTPTSYFSGSYKNLTINSTDGTTDTFQMGATLSVAEALVLTAGTFDANTQTVSVTGVTTVNATYTGSTGTNTFTGGLAMTGGTLSTTGAGSVVLGGDVTGNSSATTSTISGKLDLGAATRTFTIADGAATTDMSISAVVSNGGVTKAGAGTLVLSGANTYTSATTVSAGILNIQNATATGTTAGGISVTSGAALEIQGGITVGAEALTLNGTGISSGGALRNISGTNSMSGAITLGAATRINSDSGTLTLTGGITGTGFALTVGGSGNTTLSTSGINTSTAGTLTKDGTGTLTLSAAGNYTGATTISAGVVNIRNATSLGTTATGTTVTSGAALEIQGGITVGAEALTLNGTGISSGGALRNISGTNSMSGAITLGAATRINSDSGTLTLTGGITGSGLGLTVGGSGNTTLSTSGLNTSTNGTLTKDGTGTLTITASGDYTGATTVSAGILNIQNATATGTTAGGISVTSGAALEIQGGITVGAEALTLNGTGISSGGALRNISGTNSMSGAITLGADSSIGSDADTLTLSGAISGGFALTKVGAGGLTISNTATVSNLTISAGTLTAGSNTLNVSGDWSNSGTFTAGTSTVAFTKSSGTQTLTAGSSSFYNLTHSGAGTLQLLTNTLTVTNNLTNSGGTLDANGIAINVAATLDNSGGTYTANSNTLTLNGTNQSVLGAATFYNLTKTVTSAATLTFQAATSFIVSNTLTLQGALNNLLSVVSSIADTQFNINIPASFTLNFLNIKDLNNTNATNRTVTNSQNSGNNTNITFSATTVTWTGTTSTSWGTATNWDVGYVPNSTDNVVIADVTNDPILDTNRTVNNLTINSGGLLALNGNNLTLTGTFTNPGTLMLQGGETLTGFTNDTTQGTITYNGTSSYTGLKAGNSYYNLTFNGSGGTWTLNAALTAANNLTITAGTLDVSAAGCSSASCAVSVAGNWSNAGTFTPRSGTVTFNGSAAQALTGETFYNLTINNSAASPSDTVDVDSSAAVTVTNTLTVTDGQFSPTTGSVFATVTIGTNGILKPDSGASITASANWGNSGTFTANSGTVTLTSTSGSATVTAGGSSFYNLTQNGSGGTYTLQDAATVSNVLTITAGTLSLGSQTLTLSGTSGTPFSNSGTFTASTGTVLYTGNNAGGNTTVANVTYYNLTLNNASETYVLAGNTTVSNNLTITAGTLDAVSGQNYGLTVGGTWSNAGTFTPRLGTVTLTGTSTFSDTTSFYDVTINGSAKTVTLGGALTTTNNLTITAGTLDVSAAGCSSASCAVSVGGNFSNAGTFQARSGTVTLTSTSASATLTSGGSSFYNLTQNGSGGTYTLQDALTASNNLTITAGTLDVSASNCSAASCGVTIGGNYANSGTFTKRTGTVTFNAGSGTQTLNSGSSSFYKLTHSGAGTLQVITNTLTVSNTLTNSSGTLDLNGIAFTATGATISNTANIQAQGGETITGFTNDSTHGTITYVGTSSYTGLNLGNTYYNITFNGSGGTWTLNAAPTINNNLTITAGTLSLAGYNLAVTGTFSNLGTLRLNGAETSVTSPTALTTVGTIAYNNTAAVTSFLLGNTYYNLTLSGSGTVTLAANVTTNNNLTISSGATLAFNGYDANIAGNFINSGTASGTSTRTITLSGTTQTFTPGSITLGTLTLSGSSGTASLGNSFTLGNLLSIAAGRVLSILSYTLTATDATLTNNGTISFSSGELIKPQTAFYLADSNFDVAPVYSIPGEKVYVSLSDQSANLDGQAADTVSITISCPTDSEAVTLTETTTTSGVFRNSGGLTTAAYSGSATNNNGTLTCADAVTITATYTDPHDASDTGSATATSSTDARATAPSSFAGSAASSTSITWTWTDNSSNETGFKLYNSSGTLIATIATANATSYTETGLTKATSYTRKVVAYNNAGNSSYSNSASVTTPAEPNAPTALSGVAASNSSITWSWTQNSNDEDGFLLQNSSGTTIATIAANVTTYTETGLSKNTSYSRKVVAYNSDGNSTATSLVSVTTSNNHPASFSLVSPADGALVSTGLPTFSFRKSTVTGGSIASYTLHVGSLTFTGINPSGPTQYSDRYTATYLAENDGNADNDTIQVTLKDNGSATLPLADNSYTWYVTAIDDLSDTKDSSSRTVTVDATSPTITTASDAISTTDTTYTLSFTAKDAYQLAEVTVTLEKANSFFSTITGYTALETRTYTANTKEDSLSMKIDFTPKNALSLGSSYRYILQATDSAGHTAKRIVTLKVLSAAEQARAAAEADVAALNPETDSTDTIVTSLRAALPASPLNFPELEIKSLLRRQRQAENLHQIFASWGPAFWRHLGWLQQYLLAFFQAVDRAATVLAQAFTTTMHRLAAALTPSKFLAFVSPAVHRVGDALQAGQDTRVKQGLANRQLIQHGVAGVLTPVQRTTRSLALKARATYELWWDKEATKIYNLAVLNLSPTAATITWETNHLSRNSKVNYGTSTSYGQEVFEDDSLTDHHAVTITNLVPDTLYYFEVMNQQADYVYDAYYTLKTLPAGAPQSTAPLVPQTAILLQDTEVRQEPDPESAVLMTLKVNTEFRALLQQDGWVAILLPTGAQGWVPVTAITLKDQTGESASAQHSSN